MFKIDKKNTRTTSNGMKVHVRYYIIIREGSDQVQIPQKWRMELVASPPDLSTIGLTVDS